MKSTSSFNLRPSAMFAVLSLAVLLALPTRSNAGAPVLAVPSNVAINDEQSTNLFVGVNVTEGNTNVLTVYLDYSPTNFGTLSPLPSGVTFNGTKYLVAATNAVQAETLLSSLVFTPVSNLIPVPNFSNVVFHAYILDASTNVNSNTSFTQALTLKITAKNNAPTLTASAPLTHNITDKTNTLVFTGVTIADVDNSGVQPVTVQVTLDDSAKGDFTAASLLSSGFNTNSLGYVFTGTAAAATTKIALLKFTPTPNRMPVGVAETTTFTITVNDTFASVTNAAYTVTATSANDLPVLTGVTTNHSAAQTGQSAQPFAVLTIQDVDPNTDTNITAGEDLAWSVTLSGATPLGHLELNGTDIGTNYSSTDDPAAATTGLRSLIYRAPTLAIANTNVLTFAVGLDDGHGATVVSNLFLDLYSVVTPPGLSGTQLGQIVNDNTTIAPFSKVNIQSFNGSSITVQIYLAGSATNDAQGQLINLGGFTRTTFPAAPSLYQFTGTSEGVTAAIHALLFQPTPNRISGSGTDTAIFGITLVDGPITNVTDTTTSVIVVPVNDAPLITGISPLVTIQDSETLTPFATTLITDADESGQQSVTATITLDVTAKGAFSTNSLIASGFTNISGSYSYSGSPANLTAAIRQLVFVPTPNRVPVGLNEITTFTIALNDGHGGSLANVGTQVRVVSSSGLPIVTLPQPQPVSVPVGTNIYPFQSVSVADATLLKVSVRINNTTQGFFTTNSVLAAGFTNSGGGVYLISGVATNITAALGKLDFSPSVTLPVGAVINFTISVTNALPNYVTVNHAIVLRTVQNSFIVTKLTDYDPNGSASLAEKNGTLRKAIADAKSNDHITFDIRSTVIGQPDYPAVIHLVAPIVLDNNLTFDGPGADSLTISGDSDANGSADVQLFTVNSQVTMNRLTFTKGFASFAGGAFEVTEFGDLKLSYCAVTDSTADVWGGGVDVDHGSLVLEHCLIAGNKTSSSLGQGGGGVSLYTEMACSIVNTTFATNRQVAIGGLGGGALYVETADAGVELDVTVLNCTFHDNRDAAGHGTSIRPNVFNTFVKLQNSIVADGQGKNMEMDQSGTIVSLGGNISDDATATTFSTGGSATNTFIFHPPLDLLNYSATNFLAALANNGGPTLTFALTANNLALDHAVSNAPDATFYTTLGTDQRGYFRNQSPDIGAFERNAAQRIIIQEIHFNPAAPNTNNEFIEFYVPHDSAACAVDGFKVLVDGVLRHTFSSQSLQPGEALVLFSHDASNTGLPSGVYSQIAAANLQMDNASGNITLLNSSNQVVYEADYVGAFTSTDPNDYGLLTNNQSLVLSPPFAGVFLPYQRVVAKQGGSDTNSFSNPGYDATGRPLAIGNAPPLAYDDSAATDAHTILTNIFVLANDVESDITDTIRVVDVGTNGNVTGTTNYSLLGARVIINNSGATISYDPTASAFITALPQGSNVVDSFRYAILDSSNGVDHVRGSTPLEIAENLAKATATVTVNVVGVNSAPTPQMDDVNTNPLLTTPEDVVLDFTTATNILANDTDPNSDDNSTTLNIVSLSPTNGYTSNLLSVVSMLGATATLDIRFDRNETHITYDPRGSAILNTLGFGQTTNDTFYYSVKDRYNVIGTAAIHIQVTGVNDVPTANPNLLTTDEDTAITIADATLLANDTDYDQATVLHVSAVTPVSALGASVTLVGTNVIYNPTVSTNLNALANKEFATDTFTYTAMDEHGLSSNAIVTVIVAGVNDRPILQPDAYATDEETLFTTNSPGVLVNDREPDINGLLPDDSFRVIPATNITPNNVVVVMNADGSFGYNPYHLFDWLKELQTTNEYINYVVMDHSLSIANNDTFAITATSSNNILPVLANDAVLSAVGGAFTLTGVTTPNHGGTVSLNIASNSIVYTPLAGYVGTENFSYTAADGLGGSDTAVVTVTLTASTLTANPDSYTVATGTTNSLDLLINDSLIPATGASVTIASLGSPSAGGTVSLNGFGPNNLVSYTPNPSNPCPFVETFNYRITSGTLSATGIVSVTVLDRGNGLTANNDFFTVIAGGGNNSLDVLGNDLILPGPNTNLTITAFNSNSVLGTVSLNTAHTRLVYKPSNTVTNHQEPLIAYTISDGAGGTATAYVSIRVQPSGFFANDDTFVVVKNSTNTLPVMINDVILPNLGQTLFISGIGVSTNAPNHNGSVTINGPGTGLVYKPAANFNGGEDFTYEISDGSPARALGHVHVVVLDNSPATSNPDTYRVMRDSANNALDVLNNDYTLPKTFGALTISGLQTNGVHGTVARNNAATNNLLLYTPNSGFIGRDYFNYEFTDLLGNKGTNTVAVTVGDLYPNNDLFSAVSDSITNVLEVRANDLVYPDSSSLRLIYSFGVPDQGGTVTTNSSATAVLYTPAAGFVGVEHFAYTLKDDSTNLFSALATVVVTRRGSDRETNTVTMTVIGVNDIPTIAGSTNSAITDKQTVHPFATISIGDLDEYGLQLQTAIIRMDHTDNETLQNLGGFSQISLGVFKMQGTPTNISTALRNIIFAPVENHIIVPTTVVTHLLLSIDDGYITAPVTNLTTVAVTAVNDPPTTAGAGNYNITDKQTVNPFAGIVIADVDDDALQSLTVRISPDHLDNQTLTNLGGFTLTTNGVFTLSGTPANLTTALRGIVFAPVENHITVPTTVTTRLTLTVDDSFAPTVTNAITTVAVTAVNDSPTTAGAGNYNITDKQTVNPFASIVIADVDDDALQSLTVRIALDNLDKQSLTNLGGFAPLTNGLFTLTGTPTNLTTALRGIVFVPTPNHIPVPTSSTTHLLLTVDDTFAPTVTNNLTTVTVTATNDAPTITGNGNYNISDKQTVQPFASIVVADVDDDTLQPLTVRLLLDHLDNGALQNLGGFTQTSNGVFTLYGYPTNITTALRGMTYVPVPNHIPVPTTQTTHLVLSADDAYISSLVTNLTTVNITASNDAPVISGTVAGQIVYDRGFIRPFTSALITELDNDRTQALRITVTLDSAAKGNLSDLGGFVSLGGGVYSYGASNGTVTAAQATTALRGLLFTPTTVSRVTPGAPEITQFTIRVDDFFAPTVMDTNTTVIAIDALTAKVVASDKSNGAQFGWSVAATRDLALIGAPHDTATNAGAAYLYARSLDGSNTWTQIRKFTSPDAHAQDEFGTAVAMTEDTVVIGARFADEKATDAGAAYVFSRNHNGTDQWGFVAKLMATDGAFNDQFGSAIAISNTLVVIGAPLADAGVTADVGAGYLFERDLNGLEKWGQFKKLVATNAAVSDHFGTSVAISADSIAVGAPLTDVGTFADAGAVYIFGRNQNGPSQWGQVRKLTVTNTVAGDRFGTAVSLSGDNLAVGAPFYDVSTFNDAGAAYVFNRNQPSTDQWGLLKKLTLTNAFTSDHFGNALAIADDSLVIGAPLADGSGGNDYGVAYLYQQNQGGSGAWGQVDKFLPAAVGTSDNFGCAVAVSRNTVVVGAYNGLDSTLRSGTAYMFRVKYNNPPRVVIPLANQIVTPSSPLAYTLPVGAFSDPDQPETLTISLGGVPPAWLNFNAFTGAFSGTPNSIGSYPVAVVATDSDGATVTNQFSIEVMAVPNTTSSLALGFQTFGTNQLTVITLSGVSGVQYRLQRTPSLSGTVIWTDVASGTADNLGAVIFYDVSSGASMFYRTVVP